MARGPYKKTVSKRRAKASTRRAETIRAQRVVASKAYQLPQDIPFHNPYLDLDNQVKLWITGDGRRIPIDKLTNTHIVNIVNYFLRRAEEQRINDRMNSRSPSINNFYCPLEGKLCNDNLEMLGRIIDSIQEVFKEAREKLYPVICEGVRRGVLSGKYLSFFTMCLEEVVISSPKQGYLKLHNDHAWAKAKFGYTNE
jgi:hypothetical protein